MAVNPFASQLDGRCQQQSDRRRRHTLERGIEEWTIALDLVHDADAVHEEGARQANPEQRDKRANNAVQAITDEDRQIHGLQAGNHLTDDHQFHERSVIKPAMLLDDAAA
jgi:hypothetical protein